MIAPSTVPTPPLIDAPPMNAAAIASSSKLRPALGEAALKRAANTRPARAASMPMFRKTRKVTFLSRTPDSLAAGRLPPIA